MNKFNKNNINVIIYHSPHNKGCPDGDMCKLCAYLFLRKVHPNKQIIISNQKNIYTDLKQDNAIVFFPTNYIKNNIPNFKGKNVLMCDISFPKNVIDNIIKEAASFLLIDHHETAEKELINLNPKYKIFNKNHCAAWLTWEFFFPKKQMPLLIKYVESRDIWTKNMPNTDAFSYWFDTIPKTFDEYEKYLDNNKLMNMIDTKGLAYQELNKYYINASVNYAIPKFVKIHNKYYFVVYLNGTMLQSDLGNKLITEFKMANFSAIYTVNDRTNSTSFSLRSTDKHTDVSQIAGLLGGGGHKNASGVLISKVTNILNDEVYDSTDALYKRLPDVYSECLKYEKERLNVIYLESQLCKHEIGKYLLQTKYEKVQEASALMNIINGWDENELFDMSVIWNFDGTYTTFVLNFADHLDSAVIKNVMSRYKFNDKFEMIMKGKYWLLPYGC